jgi:hypothetical protein
MKTGTSLQRGILAVLIGLFLVSVLAAISIDIYYYIQLPDAPDPATERTNRMEVSHGSVRYGSQGELHVLRAVQEVFPMGAVFFLAAGLLGLRWGIFHVGPTGRVKQPQPGAKGDTTL